MTLTQEEIDQLEALSEKFEEAVCTAVGRYNAHVKALGHPTLALNHGNAHIDCGEICVEWEEYWSYGGHDSGEYILPLEIILPDNQHLSAEMADKAVNALEERARKTEETARQNKLAELARLQKELGIE